jgi:hypothetical protein
VRYSFCVQEDDKRDTLHIEFFTCSEDCRVIVYAVIWRLSKVNILFPIFVLLMQFRNSSNSVKRGKKKEKKKKARRGE